MLPINPWVYIWIHPKKCVKNIIAYNPNFRIWALATIFGFVSLLFIGQNFSLGNYFSFKKILLGVCVLAPFWGYAFFSLSSWLINLIGKLLHAKGRFTEIRTVVAWSCVPYVFHAILWIIILAYFRGSIFSNFVQNDDISSKMINIMVVFFVLKLFLSIWSFVLLIQGLSYIQEISIAKTILNVIGVFFILGVLLGIFSKLFEGSLECFKSPL